MKNELNHIFVFVSYCLIVKADYSSIKLKKSLKVIVNTPFASLLLK